MLPCVARAIVDAIVVVVCIHRGVDLFNLDGCRPRDRLWPAGVQGIIIGHVVVALAHVVCLPTPPFSRHRLNRIRSGRGSCGCRGCNIINPDSHSAVVAKVITDTHSEIHEMLPCVARAIVDAIVVVVCIHRGVDLFNLDGCRPRDRLWPAGVQGIIIGHIVVALAHVVCLPTPPFRRHRLDRIRSGSGGCGNGGGLIVHPDAHLAVIAEIITNTHAEIREMLASVARAILNAIIMVVCIHRFVHLLDLDGCRGWDRLWPTCV